MRLLRGRADVEQLTSARPTYEAAVELLASRGRFGIRLGLGRTRALLRAMGNPERELRGPLIGGTNGKGSVQALVGAALREAGWRVGQTPKPHLSEYRERVVVDGRPIARDDFAAIVADVLAVADRLPRSLGPPTEFEALTCAAFVHFARSSVDVAVVEVGMGGRLDATNAWQGGVSAITNVALDHTEYLGPTTTAIAREKAQIIKRGDAAAVTAADGDALRVIRRRAARVGVPLHIVRPLPVIAMDRSGVHAAGPDGRPLSIGLLGRHQAANAAVAWAILDALGEADIAPSAADARRRAFAAAHWPGRLELLSLAADGTRAAPALGQPGPGRPDVLLDGAHNPHGMAALVAAVDELRGQLSGGRPTVLLGMLRDKDVTGMLAPLRSSSALAGARVIATRVPGSQRALPAEELAAAWGRGAQAIDEAAGALAAAVDASRAADGPLVICGSLYLVGRMRELLLPDAASHLS